MELPDSPSVASVYADKGIFDEYVMYTCKYPEIRRSGRREQNVYRWIEISYEKDIQK